MSESAAGPLQIFPVLGMPEVKPGDDLGSMIAQALRRQGLAPQDDDVLVVTQKVVSKAEGRVVRLDDVAVGAFAGNVAQAHQKDPRVVQLVLNESTRIVKMARGLLLTETRHGFVCANSGVDLSNVSEGWAVLLPVDPDASAAGIRKRIAEEFNSYPAVVISDTFGRPWRIGQTNVAIGVAGMAPVLDYRGDVDDHGNELVVTQIAVADELAAAAELVMGKTRRCPVALVRGYDYPRGDGGARLLVRPAEEDLFR